MALAQYLAHCGLEVSGSDVQDAPQLEILRRQSIRIAVGHSPDNILGADLVVVTAAATEENVEIATAKRSHVPVVKRAALLGQIANSGRTLAVAGTHGKTTTTALAGHLLRLQGIDVSIMGGGFVRDGNEGTNGPSVPGQQDLFVVEADEYDRSFLELRPAVAVITSLDFDHPDCYPTLDDMENAYLAFATQTAGKVIVNGASPRARSVARRRGKSFETFGLGEGFDWSARNIQLDLDASAFDLLVHGSEAGRFTTRLAGEHNVQNAVAALAGASIFADIRPEVLKPHLASFRGITRRLEPKGTVNGITVVDDYAHHPAEIAAALKTLRPHARRLLVLFQPHTYSRTKALLDEFAVALGLADDVVLLDVYAAREKPEAGIGSDALARALSVSKVNVHHFHFPAEAVERLAGAAGSGDVIVIMGAGNVGDLSGPILETIWERRALARG